MSVRPRISLSVALLVVATCAAGPALAASWKPVPPSDLALAAPKVDTKADAEVLFWDVRVSDEIDGDSFRSVYDHYVRIKVFTDRGRDALARVDIPYYTGVTVQGIEARTIRPDATTVELKRSDVFGRDIVKTNGLTVKAMSFPLPAVERGCIVEYRWTEYHEGELLNFLRLPFSREYPVQEVTYRVKPLSLGSSDIVMTALPFHGRFAPTRREGEYFVMSLSNVPAFREEPDTPSEWELKPWVLVYYRQREAPSDPGVFWQRTGSELWDADQKATAPTAAIRSAARSATAGKATVAEKVAALLAAARERITRVDINPVSTGERKRRKPAKNAGEAFDRGEGSGTDLVNVFLALARAAELDARTAYVPSRDDIPWNGALMLPYFLDYRIAVVKEGTAWRFLDPANHYDAAGGLRWTQEAQPALIPDEGALTTATTPQSGPEGTLRTRQARLALSEDGTLEGEVHCEYLGHVGLLFKAAEARLSDEERVKQAREQIVHRLPGAEVDQVRVEHVTDREAPYTLSYHVRVPGYAQRTGSRLFLQPAFFQKGLPAEFTSADRANPVAFRFAWTERDEVSIALPAGFALEMPDAPAPLRLPGTAALETKLVRLSDDSRLDLTRQFTFGEKARLRFPVSSYGAIKAFFDAVQKHAEHTITLRKKGAAQ